METLCVYHAIDLDGWMSAAEVKHWFLTTQKDGICYNFADYQLSFRTAVSRPSLAMMAYNHNQYIPDLSQFKKIIICDISFPKEYMAELFKSGKNIIWIDHHKSAIEDSIEGGYSDMCGVRNVNFAACELVWQYFFTKENAQPAMPEIIRLLGRYDCFGHKGTPEEKYVLEFQFGARNVICNYEEAYLKLIENIKEDKDIFPFATLITDIHNDGKAIYSYLCTDAHLSYKNGFEIKFYTNSQGLADGFPKKFICINKERFNPINFGLDYHKDGYDGVACFWYNNGKWMFSLYNDNGEVDVSKIAKQYGGGGHAGASGFVLNNTDFIKLITTK